MALLQSNPENPLGLNQGIPEKVRVTARGGDITKGMVVYFDLAAADAGVTASTAWGSATNPTANVLKATATHNGVQTTAYWLLAVAAEDISDDQQGWGFGSHRVGSG